MSSQFITLQFEINVISPSKKIVFQLYLFDKVLLFQVKPLPGREKELVGVPHTIRDKLSSLISS